MSRRRIQTKNPVAEPNLQEQVQLLTSENERLKAMLAQLGVQDNSQPDKKILPDESVPKKGKRSMSTTSTIPVPHTPNTPKSKGCSCRGNCATRVCGCVKKNIPCAEFCRCGDAVCQNQEPDKENIGDPNNQAQLTSEGEESLRKLSRLTLKDRNESQGGNASAGASKTQVEKLAKPRSLFSPALDPNIEIANFDEAEFANRSLRFGDVENETSEDREEESENAQGRSRRKNLKPSEPRRTQRSLSNNEKDEAESKEAKKTRGKRPSSMDGRGKKMGKPEKILTTLINEFGPLRRAAKNRKPQEPASTEGPKAETSKNEKIPKDKNNSEKIRGKEAKEKKSKSKKKDRARARSEEAEEAIDHDGNHGGNEAQELLPELEENGSPTENENRMEKSGEENIEGNELTAVKSEPLDDESDHHTRHNNRENPSDTSHDSATSGNNNSSESPGSDGSSTSGAKHPPSAGNSFDFSEESMDFDPMKPRHKLSRSPIAPQSNARYQQARDISEIPLPMPLQEEPAIELPPPQELNEPVVDWEKHQAERVRCRKCGRGFYAYRIKKHEASCHKV